MITMSDITGTSTGACTLDSTAAGRRVWLRAPDGSNIGPATLRAHLRSARLDQATHAIVTLAGASQPMPPVPIAWVFDGPNITRLHARKAVAHAA